MSPQTRFKGSRTLATSPEITLSRMASACTVSGVYSVRCGAKRGAPGQTRHERHESTFSDKIPTCTTACWLPQKSVKIDTCVHFHTKYAFVYVHTFSCTEKQNSKTVNQNGDHHSFWAEEENTGKQAQDVYFSDYV